MTSRITRRASALVAALALSSAVTMGPAAAQDGPLRLGTATEGGVWYVLGNGFAKVIGDALSRTVTPVTTAGSMENSRRLSAGNDLDLGLALATSIANGLEDGTIDAANIRAIGAGHGNFLQIVVREGSGIDSWSSAFGSGHAVGIGEPGSAAFEVTTGTIRAVGSMDDIQPARLGHQAQADALKNRDIEVMVAMPGIPTGAVVDVTSSIDAQLLSGTEEEIAKLQEAMPFMANGTIPAGVYDGQDEAISTVVLPSLMFVTADMPEETVYTITKALYENPDALAAVHSNGSQWVPENALASRGFLEEQGVEYHPGAVKYFEEKGIW